MNRAAYRLILLLAMLSSGCITTPQPDTQPAVITYRETMQFGCYFPNFGDSNQQACFKLASYYTITCIDNRGPNTIDFTMDMHKVYYREIVPGQPDTLFRVATKDIGTGLQNWTNSFLSASAIVVPHGQIVQPPQPFSFIVPFPDSQISDNGVPRPLSYESIQGQPVLISKDNTVPAPTHRASANGPDFQKGAFSDNQAPQLPPASCPLAQ